MAELDEVLYNLLYRRFKRLLESITTIRNVGDLCFALICLSQYTLYKFYMINNAGKYCCGTGVVEKTVNDKVFVSIVDLRNRIMHRKINSACVSLLSAFRDNDATVLSSVFDCGDEYIKRIVDILVSTYTGVWEDLIELLMDGLSIDDTDNFIPPKKTTRTLSDMFKDAEK